jgi:hypothetical protein
MITKFKQSWQLFKASITVTLRYRKLLWFPVLTTFLTAFIVLFFLSAMALPVVLHHTGYHLNQKQYWVALKDYYLPAPAVQPKSQDPAAGASKALSILLTGHSAGTDKSGHPVAAHGFPWGSLCLLTIYFVSMFLATFFNVAFYSEIIAALNGKGVSFRRGFVTARSRLLSILAWSLLAGVVGWIIRTLEQRLPLLLAVGVALLIKSIWFIAIAGVSWVFGLLFMAYVSGVASHVYRCALYMYATEGVVPEPYNQELLDMAWKVKKSSEKQ